MMMISKSLVLAAHLGADDLNKKYKLFTFYWSVFYIVIFGQEVG